MHDATQDSDTDQHFIHNQYSEMAGGETQKVG